MQGFQDLEGDRREGLIPWSVVTDYCDRFELDGEQRERMHYHLRRLCEVALEIARKRG